MVDEVASSNIARRRLERRAAVGRRSDERWASILSAATTVFREHGYEKATLEDIANEVGINRATLYYYVGTKEELLVALLAEPIEMVRSLYRDARSRWGCAVCHGRGLAGPVARRQQRAVPRAGRAPAHVR